MHRPMGGSSTVLAAGMARRYLFSRERQALEWIVTLISIAGVAVGVGTIIAVFGVIQGLKTQVIAEITSSTPSLVIFNPKWHTEGVEEKVLMQIRKHPQVELAEPILATGGVLIIGKQRQFTRIYATERLQPVNFFNIRLPEGVSELRPIPGHILVSDQLSTQPLDGRQALFVTAQATPTALYPAHKALRVTVQGMFNMSNDYYSEYMALGTWEDVRKLARKEQGVESVYVRLRNPMQANRVEAELAEGMPEGTVIETWIDRFEQMFRDMTVLSAGMLLVMLMTMLVAALNIIGTLTLIVIQKTREIGILKAMGASRRLIGQVFLAEGALIGVVGAVIGVIMGMVFCLLLQVFRVPMPGDMWEMNKIPAELDMASVVLTAAMAVLICTVASLGPAWRAGGLDPVEALRHE